MHTKSVHEGLIGGIKISVSYVKSLEDEVGLGGWVGV